MDTLLLSMKGETNVSVAECLLCNLNDGRLDAKLRRGLVCSCCPNRPRGGTKKELVAVISRERAPGNASENMFVNSTIPDVSSKGSSVRNS